MMGGEIQVKRDTHSAQETLLERDRKTRRFFNSIAGAWESLKRNILVDFEKHQRDSMHELYGDRWLGFSRQSIHRWLIEAGFHVLEEKSYELREGLKLFIHIARKTT